MSRFTSRISGATTQTIEDAGHMMMLERAGEFVEVVRGFLQF